MQFVWEAFWILSADRSYGFAEGPIPFSAVDRYAQRYGLDELDVFDAFLSLIRAMDAEYLKLRAAKPQDKE